METVNEKLLHHTVDHAIDLQHFGNGEVRKMVALLNMADAQLSESLTIALSRLPQDSFTVQRLDALLADVYALNGKTYQGIKKELGNDLLEFTNTEASFQYDLFNHVIPVDVSVARISPEAVYAAAVARPFQISKDRAVDLSSYLDGLSADRAARIKDAIRLGFITGETTDQIVRRIRGTKTKNYSDGLMEGSRQHIEGMVRTSISHISNFTRQRFYEANSEILKGWQFVATLDKRTTLTCAVLDGKIFPIGEGPIPPRHIRCRSDSVSVTKSFRELGIDIDDMPPDTRESMDGQVPADMTYQQWLEKQSAERQDEILGPTKAKLFRAGEKLDRFVDNKGKVLTIAQLRERNTKLFDKLGL